MSSANTHFVQQYGLNLLVTKYPLVPTVYERDDVQIGWTAWQAALDWAGRDGWVSMEELNRRLDALTKPSETHDERYLAGYETAVEQMRRMLKRPLPTPPEPKEKP